MGCSLKHLVGRAVAEKIKNLVTHASAQAF